LVRSTDRPYAAEVSAGEHPVLALARVVSPARALGDASLATRSIDQVRAVTARGLQLRLCTQDELAAELCAMPRNGSRLFRIVVAELAIGVRSAAEAWAVNQLRRSHLPDFEINVPVVDRGGALVYELDILFRRYRAVLEIDGRRYHSEGDDWGRTLDRHNALTRGALSLTHYRPSVLRSAESGWLDELETWLRARAAEIGEPYRPGSPRRVLTTARPAPFVLPR
jgi:hypothetical protein